MARKKGVLNKHSKKDWKRLMLLIDKDLEGKLDHYKATKAPKSNLSSICRDIMALYFLEKERDSNND